MVAVQDNPLGGQGATMETKVKNQMQGWIPEEVPVILISYLNVWSTYLVSREMFHPHDHLWGRDQGSAIYEKRRVWVHVFPPKVTPNKLPRCIFLVKVSATKEQSSHPEQVGALGLTCFTRSIHKNRQVHTQRNAESKRGQGRKEGTGGLQFSVTRSWAGITKNKDRIGQELAGSPGGRQGWCNQESGWWKLAWTTATGSGCGCPEVGVCVCVESGPTHCDPMNSSPPGSSVHGIFQVRILKQVAISFSRGYSQPKDQTSISCIGRQILYHSTTWEAPERDPNLRFSPPKKLWIIPRWTVWTSGGFPIYW